MFVPDLNFHRYICRGICFSSNDLRWKLVVVLVDIGEMVEHHCLNYHYEKNVSADWLIDWLIDWLSDCCSTPTWAVFQLYIVTWPNFVLTVMVIHSTDTNKNISFCRNHENTYSQTCIKRSPLGQRVSDCCLTPIQPFSAWSWREQIQWDDDDDDDDDEVHFVLDQHAELGLILLPHFG